MHLYWTSPNIKYLPEPLIPCQELASYEKPKPTATNSNNSQATGGAYSFTRQPLIDNFNHKCCLYSSLTIGTIDKQLARTGTPNTTVFSDHL